MISEYQNILSCWEQNNNALENDNPLFQDPNYMMDIYKWAEDSKYTEFAGYLEVALCVYWMKKAWITANKS